MKLFCTVKRAHILCICVSLTFLENTQEFLSALFNSREAKYEEEHQEQHSRRHHCEKGDDDGGRVTFKKRASGEMRAAVEFCKYTYIYIHICKPLITTSGTLGISNQLP